MLEAAEDVLEEPSADVELTPVVALSSAAVARTTSVSVFRAVVTQACFPCHRSDAHRKSDPPNPTGT